MAAVVIDRVAIIYPQIASVIGNNAVPVVRRMKGSRAACPTHSKVIISVKTRPSPTCVLVVDVMFPTPHVWIAAVQVLAVATLSEVKDILHE
jgi:hypothetical protein